MEKAPGTGEIRRGWGCEKKENSGQGQRRWRVSLSAVSFLFLVVSDKVVIPAVGGGYVTGKWRELPKLREKTKRKDLSKQVALGLFRFAGERRREKRVALFS